MKTLLVTISIATFQLFNFCQAQINLVGMSSHGGFGNHGTLFSVSTTGTVDTLYNFNSGLNGCSPMGGMVLANDGNLYGFTASCGSNAAGTLIRYNPHTKAVTTLVDFSLTIGGGPMGDLVLGSDGDLYGMTNAGGTNNDGTIFKCTTSGVLTVMVQFNGTNGANPLGSLRQGKDGNFYGMTRFGGPSNKGSIFQFSPSFSALKTIHTFSGADGAEPLASLTFIHDSVMYGLTYDGGAYNGGVIFYCTTSGKYRMLSSLSSTTGIFPFGSLINGKDGYLYGTAFYGGTNYYGTLFRCNDSGVVNVLANFTDTNGGYPEGTLTLASDGKFYGTASHGGNMTSVAGVVFCYDRSNSTLKDVVQFDGTGPDMPQGTLMEMNNTTTTGENIVAVNTANVSLYPNPNKGEFTLEVKNNENATASIQKENVKLEVYNTVGEMVHTENLQSNQQQSTINLGSEPAGVYIYKVMSDNSGMLANGKFVIE